MRHHPTERRGEKNKMEPAKILKGGVIFSRVWIFIPNYYIPLVGDVSTVYSFSWIYTILSVGKQMVVIDRK
jgi:hypothetical protein